MGLYRSRSLLVILALAISTVLLLGLESASAVNEPRWPYDIVHPAPGNSLPTSTPLSPAPAREESAPPWQGEVQVLVLLIQFPDYPAAANHNASYYEQMLFSHQPGSMWGYYQENSYGQFSVNGTVMPHWFNATYNMSHYGNNEFQASEAAGNAKALVREAVQEADPHIDFARFDEDGDGLVDHLAIVHSGPADESNGGGGPQGDPAIWSHRSAISPEDVDNVNVSGYFMQAEGTPMGVFAHEFGHNLGLPDLYDTDYSSAGIGQWGMMSGGSWLNGGWTPAHFTAWSKVKMGWLEPIIPEGDLVNVTLPRIEDNATAYKLPLGQLEGPEYFLIENRQKVDYDTYLPGSGLLIWHIDEGASQTNDVHRLVDLESADNDDDPNQASDPWSNSTSGFHDGSLPNATSYSGVSSGLRIHNISESGANMTFDLRVPYDVALTWFEPRLVEINRPVLLKLGLENQGYVDANDFSVNLVIKNESQRELVNHSFQISSLSSWEDLELSWNWTPTTKDELEVLAWLDISDDIGSNDVLVSTIRVTRFLYTHDFEGSLANWSTMNNGSGPMVWAPTNFSFHSTNTSYWPAYRPWGAYFNNMNQSLVTPEFNLSGLSAAGWAFYHAYSIEVEWDAAVVELTTNNGTTWQRLTPEGGYPQIAAAIGGAPAFNGFSEWEFVDFNLSDFVGEKVKLRFLFVSDQGVIDVGWFVDDVVLYGTFRYDMEVNSNVSSISLRPNGSFPFGLALTNTGYEPGWFELTTSSDENWTLEGPSSIYLSPSQTYPIDIWLNASQYAWAGNFTPQLLITHSNEPATNKTLTFQLQIKEVLGLALDLEEDRLLALPQGFGAPVQFQLLLSNLGNTPQTIDLGFEPGDQCIEAGAQDCGWFNVSGTTRMYLGPFEQSNFKVDSQPWVGALAGATFTTILKAEGGLNVQRSLTVETLQRHDLSVGPLPTVDTLWPGQNRTFELNISNEGNGVEEVDLQAWLSGDSQGWEVGLETYNLTLLPQESKTVKGWYSSSQKALFNHSAKLSVVLRYGENQTWGNHTQIGVHRTYGLSLSGETFTLITGQNENHTWSVKVTNLGNGPEVVDLSLVGAPGWLHSIWGDPQLLLRPGENTTAEVYIEGNPEVLMGRMELLRLEAIGSNVNESIQRTVRMGEYFGFEVTHEVAWGHQTMLPEIPAYARFLVQSFANVPQQFSLQVTGPSGWSGLSVDEPTLNLEPQGLDYVFLSVSYPRSLYPKPGSQFSIELEVSREFPLKVASDHFNVTVGSYHQLEVTSPATTQYLGRFTDAQFDVKILNLGNEHSDLSFQVGNLPPDYGLPGSWWYVTDWSDCRFGLEPGASCELGLRVTSKDRALAYERLVLSLNFSDYWTWDVDEVTLEVLPTFGFELKGVQYNLNIQRGETATFVMQVQNTGNLVQDFLCETEGVGNTTTKGFTSKLTNGTSLQIPAYSSGYIDLEVRVPWNTTAEVPFGLILAVTDSLSLTKIQELWLTVVPQPSIEYSFEMPELQAGFLGRAYLNITNDGNVPLEISVSSKGPAWEHEAPKLVNITLMPEELVNLTMPWIPDEGYQGLARLEFNLSSNGNEIVRTFSYDVTVHGATITETEDEPPGWRLPLLVLGLLVALVLIFPLTGYHTISPILVKFYTALGWQEDDHATESTDDGPLPKAVKKDVPQDVEEEVPAPARETVREESDEKAPIRETEITNEVPKAPLEPTSEKVPERPLAESPVLDKDIADGRGQDSDSIDQIEGETGASEGPDQKSDIEKVPEPESTIQEVPDQDSPVPEHVPEAPPGPEMEKQSEMVVPQVESAEDAPSKDESTDEQFSRQSTTGSSLLRPGTAPCPGCHKTLYIENTNIPQQVIKCIWCQAEVVIKLKG